MSLLVSNRIGLARSDQASRFCKYWNCIEVVTMTNRSRIVSVASAIIIAAVYAGFVNAEAKYIAPSIWPQPASMSTGEHVSIVASSSLQFSCHTPQSPLPTSADEVECAPTLVRAFKRYQQLMFPHKIDATTEKKQETEEGWITEVRVTVESASEEYPQLATDESYTLSIPSPSTAEGNVGRNMNALDVKAEDGAIIITAKTVYGALYGLESLSQIVLFDFETEQYLVPKTPVLVSDAPRFPHRGMLLDTSRHYQPISVLKRYVDALSYAKYNVFHWHIVDTQSFPFESRAFPALWQGAFNKQERYLQSDVRDLVEYARDRGVKVMIEFDVPGHAASWCAGYPEICPSPKCQQPLDPSSPLTFPLIQGLLQECTTSNAQQQRNEETEEEKVEDVGQNTPLFPYKLVHLGGDEVSYTCWESSAQIRAWEKEQGFSGPEDTYEYFVDKVAEIVRDIPVPDGEQQLLPVQWVEVFEHFGSALSNETIVHVWKEKDTLNDVLSAGYRALLSNQADWYLDHLDTTWQDMYLNEPTDGLSAQAIADPSLLLGGESCMWGETVDASDLENTVWPRAAAVAEVLWTPLHVIHPSAAVVLSDSQQERGAGARAGARVAVEKGDRMLRYGGERGSGRGSDVDLEAVEERLEYFRCLLTERGVGAAPVGNSNARQAPPSPGSCYEQRRRRRRLQA